MFIKAIYHILTAASKTALAGEKPISAVTVLNVLVISQTYCDINGRIVGKNLLSVRTETVACAACVLF